MDGIEMIAEERERQKAEYSAEHDDAHVEGELWRLAICLASEDGQVYDHDDRNVWPEGWSCPERALNSRTEELAMAGALLAAEIDRLQRAKGAGA